jgi:CRISP-associated protein Cas1
MSTFVVDHRGTSLDSDGASVIVRGAADRTTRVPLGPLERLVIAGEATVTTRLLSELWRRDIGLMVLSGRRREATATFLGRPHDDVALRIAQHHEASAYGNWRSRARTVVATKLAAQARLLERARAMRPDVRQPIGRALGIIADLEDRLANPEATFDRDVLGGLEGAAAAAYFGAFVRLFAPSLGFDSRRRRPPPDPVNASLSLGYTILHFDAVRELQLVGLDPMIGFLHVPDRGRASLAADLIEPLRPHVDEWVWRAFAERRLRTEHFVRSADGSCLMGKAGRTLFYADFDPVAAALRRLLRRMAKALAADLRRIEVP